MESIVIPPASASTNGFISTNEHNHGHRGHGDHGYHDRDWPERTSERVSERVFESERARGEEVRDILTAVGREGAASALAVEKTGAAGILATNVASGVVGVAVERTSAANQLATNVAGQQVLNTALQQFNLLQVQAQTNTAALNLVVEKVAAAGLLEQVKNAGAAALAAATNTAAILAAQERCCCELKEKIAEDGEKTRGLVQQIDRERLQARIVALERLIPAAI